MSRFFLGLRVAENVFNDSFHETDKLLPSKPSITDELAMSAEVTYSEIQRFTDRATVSAAFSRIQYYVHIQY